MSQSKSLPSLDSRQVERLLNDPSDSARSETAEVVGRLLNTESLSASERALANDIVSILSRDVAQTVREAVARSLRDCPLLPPSIARRLAEDVETVALPILMASEVLSESDLIELVRDGGLAKQLAIANRKTVPTAVSDALIETGRQPVIKTLLANPGAEIDAPALHRIIDGWAGDDEVARAMVERVHLPFTVQQRLVMTISQELCDLLVQRHALPADLISSFVRQGGEGALTRLVRTERTSREVEQLVSRLYAEKRLSATLILRALLEGDLQLFEAAVARLARVPARNARTVMYYGGMIGLRRLYDRTGLPSELFLAVRLGLEVAREFNAGENEVIRPEERPAFSSHVIERIVTAYREIYPAELETVLSQLALKVASPPGGSGT